MKLKRYVDQKRGRLTALARSIDVVPSLISMWANGDRAIPMESCLDIEHATDGEVTAEELRPDLNWTRYKKEKIL